MLLKFVHDVCFLWLYQTSPQEVVDVRDLRMCVCVYVCMSVCTCLHVHVAVQSLPHPNTIGSPMLETC